MDLSTLSDDELVAMNQKLGRQADALRDQRRAIVGELAERHDRARIAALEAMIADIKAGRQPGMAPGAVIDVDAKAEG